jgi:hypothetical protein
MQWAEGTAHCTPMSIPCVPFSMSIIDQRDHNSKMERPSAFVRPVAGEGGVHLLLCTE